MKSDRVSTIDTLKALGLIFVILGHHRHFLYNYIYSFHMPLFFFISGFLFKSSNYSTFISLSVSKYKRLIVPYFLLSLLLYLVWCTLSLVDQEVLKESSYGEGLLGIVYAQGQLKYMGWGVHMWFLPILYMVNLTAFLLLKLKRQKMMVILLSLLLVISHIWTWMYNFNLPWSLNILPSMLVFFLAGNCFKPLLFLIEKKRLVEKILGGIILLSLNVVFFIKNTGRIDVYQGIFQFIPYFYISAFAGILFYLVASTLIPVNRFSRYLAVNSLLIYAFHMRAFTVINPCLKKIGLLQPNTFFYAAIASILQVVILVPVVEIINRLFPLIAGRKKVSAI